MPNDNPNPNMPTSNIALLSLLGGLGGMFNPNQNQQRQPSAEEFSDVRDYGKALRDRPLPQNMSHWTQVLGAILGPLAGNYTLNRAYGLRAGANQPNPNTPPPSPNVNNPPPPGNRTPPNLIGMVDNRFPSTFRSPLVRPPYVWNNNNDDLPFTP